MPKMRIEGSFVAPPTPFNEDGSVDFAAYRALFKFQEDNGTVAVLIMGSTGEPSLLEPEEKKKIVVETAKMKTGMRPLAALCTAPPSDCVPQSTCTTTACAWPLTWA